ncbi:MAG: RidA family protein [Gammaproteobacteria bacterium]|nr:RidA family protein [Gammaproteobacteria bacterium]NIP89854.1 RidA family protein [Gammaproteobacteria bacterium]NIR22362.1 RidA family protein [Gammaproteobacteria bacterium]NIS06367.1 RidA family protein [Gammaproteobacteria bacterium]NIV46012.1 RidA family protein [Gammaproteobacteria bacterium]
MGRIDSRLSELGVELPEPPSARANYVSYIVTGSLVFVAGQLSELAGEQYKGKLGTDLSIDDGYRAARLCAVNLLAHLKMACDGDLDRVARVVEVGGFVNSAPDFYDHPKVLNGASDLLLEVFGDIGRHTRFAVGVAALPFNFAIEVKAHFEIS